MIWMWYSKLASTGSGCQRRSQPTMGRMTWLETSTENCTVQVHLLLVGEKWSLLVLRMLMNGVRRFDHSPWNAGLSESVLAVGGQARRGGSWTPSPQRARQAAPPRVPAHPQGWQLWPAMIASSSGETADAADPEGPPLEVTHADCGAPVETVVVCSAGTRRPRPAGGTQPPRPVGEALGTSPLVSTPVVDRSCVARLLALCAMVFSGDRRYLAVAQGLPPTTWKRTTRLLRRAFPSRSVLIDAATVDHRCVKTNDHAVAAGHSVDAAR